MTNGPARLIYVEDDPALRGILGSILAGRTELEVVAAVGTSSEAIEIAAREPLDVALLDFNLGHDTRSGIDLGLELRRLHPDIGVVILTQHQIPEFLTRLEERQRSGWSFVLKRADLQPRYLTDVLLSTARGLNILDPTMLSSSGTAPASRLSERQRMVMSLAARGLDASAIATEIGIKPAAARQELSRAYAVLVPEPPLGADIRTLAVLTWLNETRLRTQA